jgi:hypothetical protein
MVAHRRSDLVIRKLAAAVLALSCAALPAKAGEPHTIGPKACASCHRTVHQAWSAHKHSKSHARLPETERKNPLCVSCHATDPERPEAGVSCESCHGPGSEYAVDHLMRDKNILPHLGLLKVSRATCDRCHAAGHSTKLKPIDLEAVWNLLHHAPEPPTPQPVNSGPGHQE